MKSFGVISAAIITLLFAVPACAAENQMTASELASRMSALRQNSVSYIRVRMEIKGATKEILQLQIKERLTTNSAEIVYQALFPKDRKGESVLLRKMGNSRASGSVFVPPDTIRPIADLKESLLGSDLSYEDVIENFFAWDQQAIVGAEKVDAVNCSILESKPGKNQPSMYGSVRSWIDVRRLVPLRVEKYDSSGKLLRRIDTTQVVSDAGRNIPADLTVSGARPDSSTRFDGSRISHDITYADRDFTTEGFKELATQRKAQDNPSR